MKQRLEIESWSDDGAKNDQPGQAACACFRAWEDKTRGSIVKKYFSLLGFYVLSRLSTRSGPYLPEARWRLEETENVVDMPPV